MVPLIVITTVLTDELSCVTKPENKRTEIWREQISIPDEYI